MSTTGGAWIVDSHPIHSPSPVECMVCLPSTGGFATGHSDFTIRCWGADGNPVTTLVGHKNVPMGLALRRRSGGLVSASMDFTARVWERGACVAVLEGHTDGVSSVAVHPKDNNIVATASFDKSIRVWDVALGLCTSVLEDRVKRVSLLSVCFMACGAVVSADYKAVRVWGGDGACTVTAAPGPVINAAVAGHDAIVAGASGGVVAKWSKSGGELWQVKPCTGASEVHVHPLLCVNFPDGVTFLDGNDGSTLGSFRPTCLLAAATDGTRVFVLNNQPLHLYVVQAVRKSRLLAIHLLHTAWEAHAGVPPPTTKPQLQRALCCRRLCRVRGMDAVDMAFEVVEPFGRDVVRFL